MATPAVPVTAAGADQARAASASQVSSPWGHNSSVQSDVPSQPAPDLGSRPASQGSAPSQPPPTQGSGTPGAAPPQAQNQNGGTPMLPPKVRLSHGPLGAQQQPTPQPQAPRASDAARYTSPKQTESHVAAGGGVEASDEYLTMVKYVREARPAVVRQVLRDNWDWCFMGSEYHMAFLLNAAIHQAAPTTLSQAVKDFGQKMVQTSKHQLLAHFTPQDFDEVADLMLSRVSSQFLDRALAQRLETIDARSLVNALARAERLGYDVQDIVEEKTGREAERVVPSLNGVPSFSNSYPVAACPPAAPGPLHQHAGHSWTPAPQRSSSQGNLVPPGKHVPSHHAAYNPQPPPASPRPGRPPTNAARRTPPRRGRLGMYFCRSCDRPCSGKFALEYHHRKEACDPDFNPNELGKTICLHCGCTFGSKTGTSYHMDSAVCGKYTEETSRAIRKELEHYSIQKKQGYAVPTLQEPSAGHVAAAPEQLSTSGLDQAEALRLAPTISGHDPYAHLSDGERARYLKEQIGAEEYYGALMREAMTFPEPMRSDRLGRLKNSYSTKQSTTRKKYGIRLRERRTKEDMEAERIRLLRRPDANEVWLEYKDGSEQGTPNPSRNGGMAAASRFGQQQQQQQNAPEPQRSRVPLYEMGGLTGSVASAEMTDPTAYITPSQPRGIAQLNRSQPPTAPARAQQPSGGTQDDPMELDESTDEDTENSSDEDSSSDDDDIPAR